MRLPVRPFPPVGIVAAHLGRPAVRHLHGYDGLVRLLAYPCPPPPVSLGSRVWVALDHTRFGRRWGASLLPTLRPQVTRPGARLATGLSATALTGLDFHQLDSFEGFHQLMLSYDDASPERAPCNLLASGSIYTGESATGPKGSGRFYSGGCRDVPTYAIYPRVSAPLAGSLGALAGALDRGPVRWGGGAAFQEPVKSNGLPSTHF
jgi:hypothetical protein